MSKKVIFRAIVAVMLILVACMSLVSCKLFTENEERVYNETLYTITGKDGVQLTLTRSEIISMYSTYASYYIQYGGYTAEEVMNMVIESRIKSKYLTIEAMSYLTDSEKVSQKRLDALMGGDKNDPTRALTKVEYYAAIQSVNESIMNTLETYRNDAIQDQYDEAVKALDNTGVKEIKFADETLEYFGIKSIDETAEVYVNQGIADNMIKFVVVYDDDDDDKNKDFVPTIVPSSMITTEYKSDSAATGSTFVISFTEVIEGKDGEEDTEEIHTATLTYDVVEPRATRTTKEAVDPDAIELDGVKVNRYDVNATPVEKIDVSAKYEEAKKSGDSVEADAWRQVVNSLESNYTNMDRLYASAVESAVLSALQVEIKKTVGDPSEEDVINQFAYLYNKSKSGYATLSTQEELQTKFGENVKNGLTDVYYYPEIKNIDGYFYVYQILFKFSDEQADWLKAQINDKDEKRADELYEYMKDYIEVKESNPDYDAGYDCPYHEAGDHSKPCKYMQEKDGVTQVVADECCPSVAYKSEIKKFNDIFDELSEALAAATTPEEKIEIFLDYVYRFNDDGGIMNSSAGYLIAPDGNEDPNSFYEAFTGLARDVFAFSSEAGNAFVADGKLGYAFTPYGVHVIMISKTPFAGVTGELDIKDTTAVNAYLGRVITMDGDTLFNTIKANLKSDNESKVYSDFSADKTNVLKIDVENGEYGDQIKVNKKGVKALYEDYIEG